jgi:RNA polymerase sigma-70 factor (ECF subfamily)
VTGSWSKAYRRHGGDIHAYLARRLPRREEAEDLCQETFLRAMRAEGSLRDPDRLRAYLFSTAHNLLVNHLRRRRLVQAESELGEGTNLELVAGAGGADAPAGPLAALRDRQLARSLAAALAALPVEQRLAFTLGPLERRPYAEIAASTGWSLSKVKINVHRARKALMAQLGEYAPAACAAEADKEARA